jgi:hypothetical protein
MLLAVGCGDEPTVPSVPIVAADLTGQFIVTLTHEHPFTNPNRSCTVVSVDLVTQTWLPVTCENSDVTPALTPTGTYVRNDSLFLRVTQVPMSRDIGFAMFAQRGTEINARWSGATCFPLSGSLQGACLREFGTATLRRP